MKKALITGITGMDGSTLTDLLLEKDYEVYGIVRRVSTPNVTNIQHLLGNPRVHLESGDLTDLASLVEICKEVMPDEVYNLAAQSFVGSSWRQPITTCEITGLGALNVFEAVRQTCPTAKIYQASCHDEKTRVFTTKGLKNIDEVTEQDKVYTFNTEKRQVQTKPIKRIIKQKYVGPMISVSGKRLSQLFTPNHQVLLLNTNTNQYEYIEAGNLQDSIFHKRVSQYSLPIVELQEEIFDRGSIQLDSLVQIDYPHWNHYKNLLKEIDRKDLLYLIGLFIGDGYIKKRITGNEDDGSFFQFCIPDSDPARTRLKLVLARNNIEFNEDSTKISVSSYPLACVFRECGKGAENKHIPQLVWDNFTVFELVWLFEGLIDSDGHKRRTKRGNKYTYTTVSKKLCADFAILCTQIGKFCSFQEIEPREVYFKKDGRTIVSKRAFQISVAEKQTNKIYPAHISKQLYNGLVWCLEVEDNHNFLVEREGKVFFSGNSSEMFSGEDAPQTRTTPFKPRSPYGAAKLFAHHMARIYRESYGMFIACGILFNHTGPRRGIEFVTQKIVDHAVRQHYCGEIEALKLGNLDAKRDWSHAKDMVRGMWMMLQEGYPEDYILASGETHSVKEFVDLVYAELDTRLLWGQDSMGYDFATNPQGVMLVQSVPEFYRENEVNILQGDPTYANKYLGWEPEFTFSDLISDMIVSRIKKYYSKGV